MKSARGQRSQTWHLAIFSDLARAIATSLMSIPTTDPCAKNCPGQVAFATTKLENRFFANEPRKTSAPKLYSLKRERFEVSQGVRGGVRIINLKSSAVRISPTAYRSRSDLGWPAIVLRFVILEPTCSASSLPLLRSLAAWCSFVRFHVFGEALAGAASWSNSDRCYGNSFSLGAIEIRVMAICRFSRGAALSSIAEGVGASVLPTTFPRPILGPPAQTVR